MLQAVDAGLEVKSSLRLKEKGAFGRPGGENRRFLASLFLLVTNM